MFRYDAHLFGVTVMRGWPGYALERAGDGRTYVHHVANGHLRGPFRLLRTLIQHVADDERGRTVKALKRSLETGA